MSNAEAVRVHSRMPVILDPDAAAVWLDPKMETDVLRGLCVPPRDGLLDAYRVSTLVNNSRNDSPECIAPAN
jgi:putative SOS response-associated peptidase YedK